MFRKTIIILFTLLVNTTFAQTKKEEVIPSLEFKTILNSPVRSFKLEQLKGKIVLLEFWATWCGSCIVSMPHLSQLQKKFKDKLQIITITDETELRISQYLSKRPSNLWFAVDTANVAAGVFPYNLLPHTVLISAEGKLIAKTNPEAITEEVIDSLLRNKSVSLPKKKDLLINADDFIKTYFFAADSVINRFILQPAIDGFGGMSTTHRDDNNYRGRRITCLNVNLARLYMIAFGDWPPSRIINKALDKEKDTVYCLDLIVKHKEDLLPVLRKELAKRFNLKAKIEKQERQVNLLQISDLNKFNKITLNKSGTRTYKSSHGEIDQQSITMFEFADYLENYGTSSLPVIDETKEDRKFDIKFSFQPENPNSLTQVLNEMGLRLVKDTKEIDILLLYKNSI